MNFRFIHLSMLFRSSNGRFHTTAKWERENHPSSSWFSFWNKQKQLWKFWWFHVILRENFGEGFLATENATHPMCYGVPIQSMLNQCVHDASHFFLHLFPLNFFVSDIDFPILMCAFQVQRPNAIFHMKYAWRLSCDTKNNQDGLCVNMQSIYISIACSCNYNKL